MVKNLPAMQEIRLQSLGQKDPLEKEMATNSSIFVWRIPWTGRLAGYSPCDHKESEMTEQLTQQRRFQHTPEFENRCSRVGFLATQNAAWTYGKILFKNHNLSRFVIDQGKLYPSHLQTSLEKGHCHQELKRDEF